MNVSSGYGFSGDLRLLRKAIPIWGERHVVNLLDLCNVQAAVCEAKEIVPTKESEKGNSLLITHTMTTPSPPPLHNEAINIVNPHLVIFSKY